MGLSGSSETQAGGVHCPDAVCTPESSRRPIEAFKVAALWALFGQLLGLLDDLSRGTSAFWISFGASLDYSIAHRLGRWAGCWYLPVEAWSGESCI